MPRKLLDLLEREARLGGAAAADDDELAEFEEDDSEIVFDDVGPEVRRPGFCACVGHERQAKLVPCPPGLEHNNNIRT